MWFRLISKGHDMTGSPDFTTLMERNNLNACSGDNSICASRNTMSKGSCYNNSLSDANQKKNVGWWENLDLVDQKWLQWWHRLPTRLLSTYFGRELCEKHGQLVQAFQSLMIYSLWMPDLRAERASMQWSVYNHNRWNSFTCQFFTIWSILIFCHSML